MQALVALAFTLPPSLAFIVWAWLRLLRERDLKISDSDSAKLHACAGRLEAQTDELATLRKRMAEAETHIGQLTDRSLR